MPVPTYTEPLSPADGEVLGATHTNLWVKGVGYVHGIAASGYEPFSGAYSSTHSATEIWRGYYTYTGIKKIYNDIKTLNASSLAIYASHDGGETLIETLTGVAVSATTPIDLSAYNFTYGEKYYVRVVLDGDGAVRWAANPVANNLSWATPTTFVDGNTSSSTDLSNLTSNLNFLRKIVETPKGTFRGLVSPPIAGGVGWRGTVWSGSFFYTGLNTLESNIYSTFNVDNVWIYISDMDDTNDREVWHQTFASGNYTINADISGLSPSLVVGTRYKVWVKGDGGAQYVTTQRMAFTGNKSLTNNPSSWTPGDYAAGSSGTNRLAYIASSLSDVYAMCETVTIAGQVYGLQDLSATNASFPQGFSSSTFVDFRRTRRLRFIEYLPTGTGATGTLTYGDATQSLPDNNGDGTWTSFDLETMPLLPIGFTYKVTGVVACFESMTG